MTKPIASAKEFESSFDVSRETIARLKALHDITLRWNQKINLVSRDSATDLWQRHIADSAQLWRLRPPRPALWADLGAGAGFPGLVIAALAAESAPDLKITLVESDARKAVFLAEASRAMGILVDIRNQRIQALEALGADVLSARALAPLDQLLVHAEKHRSPTGMGLFPKGASVHKEIETAALTWRFERRIHDSITQPGAAIVEIGAVSRV